MKRKRVLICDFLLKTGLIYWIKKLYCHHCIVALNYHRIRPSASPGPSNFDDCAFDVRADEFARQMKWLKRHTRILSEKDLFEEITTPENRLRESKRPRVIITFDDGYVDNYDLAFPVLKSLDIPAFFFVCTAMINDRRLKWWDIAAYLIKKCRKPFIVMDDQIHDISTDRLSFIQWIQNQLKRMSGDRIDQSIQKLSEACEVAIPSIDLQDRELMTWDQIREMAMNRMTIGSHTHTHPILAELDNQGLQEELMLSKKILEARTGQLVQSISYPFGDSCYIPSSIQTMAIKCGYRLGFTSCFGVNHLKKIYPMALNRIAGHLDKESTASVMAVLPYLFTQRNATRNMLA